MRYIKLIGLAALAAMAFTAFAGASTASAKEVHLCATGQPTQGVCPAGMGAYSGTIKTSSTDTLISTSLDDIECDQSAMTLTANSSAGEPITGSVTALSFSGCRMDSLPSVGCTFTVRNLPYQAEFSMDPVWHPSEELYAPVLRVTDPAGAGAKVVCGNWINCEFLTNQAELGIENGTPTEATLSEVQLQRTGALCPETVLWSATYAVSSPAGFMVL